MGARTYLSVAPKPSINTLQDRSIFFFASPRRRKTRFTLAFSQENFHSALTSVAADIFYDTTRTFAFRERCFESTLATTSRERLTRHHQHICNIIIFPLAPSLRPAGVYWSTFLLTDHVREHKSS